MSEILTIDTSAGIQTTEKIDQLPIYGEDFPLLQKAMPEYVGEFPNPALVTLAKRMRMTMKLYAGLGLSANQCGVSERMFVIGTDQFQMACINPKIIDVDGDPKLMREGCLSVPGYFEEVDRSHEITVRALDRLGKPFELQAEGLMAVCIQHEMDHLDGKLFVDYLTELKRSRIRKKLEKEQRQRSQPKSSRSPAL
jgi:peptide deformylase